ncbi:hypothetical protein [Priestia megaterium]|uniref:hypothetical protein n=1 Tax=Priestia megaterium TaxID=1404 RepID=UPI002E1FB9A1|nr:hypothetical protein [Priestia megaterium]MED4263394.1 hypothetical protein [Priestia megaterium]MED4276726.1 hypothetical protein [Priestia megaterium]MED4316495.1 hypothetical protein [Priestia megaterium]
MIGGQDEDSRGKRSLAWKSPAVQLIPPIYSSLAGIDLVTSQLLFYETFWLVKRIVIQRDGGIRCLK